MSSLPLGAARTPAPARAIGNLSRKSVGTAILGLAALLAAATYGFYHRDLNAARRSSLAGSTLVRTACGPTEYAVRGSGPPVLSIHGTGGGWDQGLFAARGLINQGYQVIAPSRFGYLRTPMPERPSPQAEADFFVCLLDALNLERVPVVAASAGATPAIQLALRYPERVTSLVLIVPAIGGIAGPDTVDGVSPFIMNVVLGSDFPFWAAMRAYPKATLAIVAVPGSLVPTLSPEGRDDLDGAIAGILPVSSRRRGILYDANNQKTEPRYPLESMTVPTLVVSAKDDLYRTLANARVAAARIPGARLIVFETGGHLLLDRGPELWPAIARFIGR